MTFAADRGRVQPPNLDDRSWPDLVLEMRALIPKYAPAWTDQSPSDLGMTLIELFAALAEGVLYRLNQVPDRDYIALLNLLDITRDPAIPARTYLTFTSGAGAVPVPAGTQAQTRSQEGQAPVVFETDEDVSVLATTLKAAVVIGPFSTAAASATYVDQSSTLIGPPTDRYLLLVPPGQSIQVCLGFDRPVTDEIALGLRLVQPVPADAGITATVSYSTGSAEPLTWPPVPALRDGTDALRHDGTLRCTAPADWAAQRAGGPASGHPWTTVTPADGGAGVSDPLFWIGLRITAQGSVVTATVDRLLFNSASARTAVTIATPELLGQGSGQPFQTFPLAHQPLFRRPGTATPFDHLAVQVDGRPWTLVEEIPPGPGTFYLLEPIVGEIRFGNYDSTQPGQQGHGTVPPLGSQIQAVSYRYVVGGAAGNVTPQRVTVLGSARGNAVPAGITAVSNLGPGRDGVDEEPVEDTLRRAPGALRTRDRAVTVVDYESLVDEAGAGIVVHRCLTPQLQAADFAGAAPQAWKKGDPWTFAGIVRAPGSVNVILVPDRDLTVPRPQPTLEQLRQVRAYLAARRDLTVALAVHGPRYLPVMVKVALVVWQAAIDAGATEAQVKADTLTAIQRFLHPTRGGPTGAGWAVGQSVLASDLFRAVSPPEDLGYVSLLQVQPDVPDYHFPPLNPGGTPANYDPDRERPYRLIPPPPADPFAASVRAADYELVCAADDAKHLITTSVQQA